MEDDFSSDIFCKVDLAIEYGQCDAASEPTPTSTIKTKATAPKAFRIVIVYPRIFVGSRRPVAKMPLTVYEAMI